MTFWDHLEELRSALLRSFAVLAVLMVAGLLMRQTVFGFILAPCNPGFPTYRFFPLDGCVDIVNLEIAGQFTVHLRASLMLAIVVGAPYLVWEIWRFVLPALYENEKRGVGRAFLASGVLFYVGAAIGYFILLPLCLSFFQHYVVSGAIVNTFSLQSYISLFSSMVLLVGIVFEFPVLIMILSSMGVISRDMLRRGRRYALVAVMVVAAFITPADLGSMIIVTLPLYGLYELSILCCRRSEEEQ